MKGVESSNILNGVRVAAGLTGWAGVSLGWVGK